MKKIRKLPIPKNEQKRLESILDYDFLDAHYEKDLDQLTTFASKLFNVPIVLITIIDEKRQWFKSNHGLSVKETERSISFCQYTIMGEDIFEIENTHKDDRFSSNPLVTHEPEIRFYAGTPLINEKGYAMGSLALIDKQPRKLSEEEKKNLKLLGKQVIVFFELTMNKKALEKEKELLEKRVIERTQEINKQYEELEIRDKKLVSLNNELSRFIYKLSHDLLGPIKSLQGLTNLALDQVNQEEVKNYLQLLKKTEDKLDRTIISLVKLISVREPCKFKTIEWEEAINNTIKRVKKRFPEHEVQYKTTISATKPLTSDQALIEVMLEEFFANSILYNYSTTPQIDIQIFDSKDGIAIEISDNGIGLREEDKAHIFEMFYKTEKSSGSGLGLYLAKNIIDKMEGEVTAETLKNSGTKFSINIPT
ncbi:GAF domain-containing sensor histidine kinase [Cytophagaceae bacterium ABcell3]|nr:GAF domain-containing sensor histidine kinase [Cytophagaceae bacterium ABcell3]